jgi:hypothetical protein
LIECDYAYCAMVVVAISLQRPGFLFLGGSFRGRCEVANRRRCNPTRDRTIRKIYAVSGSRGVTQKDLQDSLESWEKDHWHNDAYDIADNYLALGDTDRAFIWINKAADVRSTMLFWLFIERPQVVRDPRFAEVKRKMTAPQ